MRRRALPVMRATFSGPGLLTCKSPVFRARAVLVGSYAGLVKKTYLPSVRFVERM